MMIALIAVVISIIAISLVLIFANYVISRLYKGKNSMTTCFDAVIFDWAGTTVDYGCFAPVRAFQEAFIQFGIEPTMDETRRPMGMLKHDHVNTMMHMDRIARAWEDLHGAAPSADDVDAVYAKFEPMLFSILDQYADPKPGVLDTVAELRAMGLKIGSTTGYTDAMMDIVVPKAAEQGYAPDYWISADSVNGFGRPYPYMIFENMKALHLADVRRIAKVGDTLSDIGEGKAAGVFTIGVIAGSSQMGMTLHEFEALSDAEKNAARTDVRDTFVKAGADAVIDTVSELPALLCQIA